MGLLMCGAVRPNPLRCSDAGARSAAAMRWGRGWRAGYRWMSAWNACTMRGAA